MPRQLPRRVLIAPFVALSGDGPDLSSTARHAQEALEIALRKSGRYRLLPDTVALPPDWKPGTTYDADHNFLQNAVVNRRADADYVLAGMFQPLERRDRGRTLRVPVDVFLYDLWTVRLIDAFRATGEARVKGEPPFGASLSEAVGRSVQKAARRLETLRLPRARIRDLARVGGEGYWATMDCDDCRKAGFAQGMDAIVVLGTDRVGSVNIYRVGGNRLCVIPVEGTRVRTDSELQAYLPQKTLTLPEL
jgi:hypothetical protein